MQGTLFWSLVQEDRTYCGAAKPVHHSYWAPTPEKPLQWEMHTQQRRPSAAKKKRSYFPYWWTKMMLQCIILIMKLWNAENFKNQGIDTNKTNDISYKAFDHEVLLHSLQSTTVFVDLFYPWWTSVLHFINNRQEKPTCRRPAVIKPPLNFH